MIHTQDSQDLSRMLGIDESSFNRELVYEYEKRLRMYHACGHSGPIGTLALIDLVRSMGCVVANLSSKEEKATDWWALPRDGSARIEARFVGAWLPGVFLGFVDAGTLMIRLDEETMVRECRPCHARFIGITDIVSVDEDAPKIVPEVADYDFPEVPTTPVFNTPTSVSSVSVPNSGIDWTKAKKGDPVWAMYDGDIVDATFVKLGDEEGKNTDKFVTVKLLDDKIVSVGLDGIQFAGV